jgi:hypothetical protein
VSVQDAARGRVVLWRKQDSRWEVGPADCKGLTKMSGASATAKRVGTMRVSWTRADASAGRRPLVCKTGRGLSVWRIPKWQTVGCGQVDFTGRGQLRGRVGKRLFRRKRAVRVCEQGGFCGDVSERLSVGWVADGRDDGKDHVRCI